jgi:hypothetical protein
MRAYKREYNRVCFLLLAREGRVLDTAVKLKDQIEYVHEQLGWEIVDC